MERLTVGLVGIGGFGRILLQYIGKLQAENRLELAAVCDIQLDTHRTALTEAPFGAVRTYTEYAVFLAAERKLDAIILATPIPLHVDMGIQAMTVGYNVLLEKPPALTIQDIDRMIEVHRQTGKVFAVGFQHTSETSFRQFSDTLRQGRIGKIEVVSAVGLWKRTHGYFTRSPWVGKLLVDGNYVLDGTVNNPFSHLLLNSLILAGLQCNAEVAPAWVQAELYSANDIKGEDTSCLRAAMENGVEVFFCSSICGRENTTPFIRVRGTEGWASWDYDGWIRYGESPTVWQEEYRVECDRRYDHLLNFVDFLQGRCPQLSCSLENTRKFVLTANLAFESAGAIRKIGEEALKRRNGIGQPINVLQDAEDYLYVKDIESILQEAVTERKLFSEMGVEWAAGTTQEFASGYKEFSLFKKGSER